MSLEARHSSLWRGSGGTYVEVIMRFFGLNVGSHYDCDFSGVSSGLVVFVKLSCVEKNMRND